jgi:hypothetical protein
MIYFKNNFYDTLMIYDLSHKLQTNTNLDSYILDTNLSAVVSKKNRHAESATTKLSSLFLKISGFVPQLKLTNSFITFNLNINKNNFLYFILSYLKDTGRYTISPLSIHKNQVNFIFNDYSFLANFLSLNYDFFNWRYNIRVCVNFNSSNLLILKMIIFSLIIITS